MAQPLDGIKILELASYMAGPMTAKLLAEHGAEVIKVERPGGDPYRANPWFALYNRSKKSVVINLKTQAGQEAVQKLAAQSEVLIESFMPGKTKRLGIDYETLSQINERLVYCSITGFGHVGPYRDIPGWEPVVQGYASMQYYQGGLKGDLGKPIYDQYGNEPVYSVLPYASTFCATQSAYAIMAALICRDEIGKGQFIDSSLFAAILSNICASLVRFPGFMFIGTTDQRGGNPIYRLYQGSEGRWFFLAAGNERMVQNLYVALDHPEWVSDPRISRFAPVSERQDQLKRELEEIFKTKTVPEWLEILREADVPADYVMTPELLMDDPQAGPDANDMVARWKDPILGWMRGPSAPLKFSETPGEIKGPAPILGQHSLEVLGGLGYSELEVAALAKA